MSGIELLAPARNLECGIAAIGCGADAVYIGAPRFGARSAAGNTVEDIAALVRHAHKYWARVYVTLNTLLFDDEIPAACRFAWELHETGVDGLIIQDTGLLECELPPLPLIASTQMHNHTPQRVAFLERAGFHRAILARELELEEIRAIHRAAPRIELECFVHGALCVCYSGQCYLSYALGGRSGNRGECAQPCRRSYTLVDAQERVLESERHLLSLRDLNLSNHVPELLEAGITSFKIEGRLKDRTYVANLVAHYRARLDAALAAAGLRRSSSGRSSTGFTPDPAKTFNRGFTTYFLHGRTERIGSPETPKMVGERIGRVVRPGETVGRVVHLDTGSFTIDSRVELHAADGLCFFDSDGQLRGTVVNAVDGHEVVPQKMDGIDAGTVVYRNHDHEFLTRVERSRNERRIEVRMSLSAVPGALVLAAEDEDRNRAEAQLSFAPEPAKRPDQTLETIRRQLQKTGDTEFISAGVEISLDPVPFLPVSVLNSLRRDALERLSTVREKNRLRTPGGIVPNDTPYPETELSYLRNVLNQKAEAFYRRHGVRKIERAAESGLDMRARKVMTTRYCIKHQLGICPRENARWGQTTLSQASFARGQSGLSPLPRKTPKLDEPLALINDEGRRLELRFDCARCEMEIYLAP